MITSFKLTAGLVLLKHSQRSRFESSELLIPRMNEQHRIVSKIDELFSDLDAGGGGPGTGEGQAEALPGRRAEGRRRRAS